MLVLSRKKNEKIIIGGNIEIKVVEILGGKVRLGIDAPKEISVHRHEVYEAIQKEMKENYGSNLEGKVGEDIRRLSQLKKDKLENYLS
jgi:carbon storage regulator